LAYNLRDVHAVGHRDAGGLYGLGEVHHSARKAHDLLAIVRGAFFHASSGMDVKLRGASGLEGVATAVVQIWQIRYQLAWNVRFGSIYSAEPSLIVYAVSESFYVTKKESSYRGSHHEEYIDNEAPAGSNVGAFVLS